MLDYAAYQCPVAETHSGQPSLIPSPGPQETRLPPGCSLDDLSFAVATLRFLFRPLIRPPLSYAGGQPKRSAPLSASRNSGASQRQHRLAPLDSVADRPLAAFPVVVVLFVVQVVFLSAVRPVHRPLPAAFHQGGRARCPLKTTPAGRPCWRSLAGEGRRTRRTAEHEKKRP